MSSTKQPAQCLTENRRSGKHSHNPASPGWPEDSVCPLAESLGATRCRGSTSQTEKQRSLRPPPLVRRKFGKGLLSCLSEGPGPFLGKQGRGRPLGPSTGWWRVCKGLSVEPDGNLDPVAAASSPEPLQQRATRSVCPHGQSQAEGTPREEEPQVHSETQGTA